MTTITYLTHSIRTAKSNDRLLALKDLCLITGQSRPDKAVKLIPDEHKSREIVETTSGEQRMIVVDPHGVVALAETRRMPEFAAWARERFGLTETSILLAEDTPHPETFVPVMSFDFEGRQLRVVLVDADGNPWFLRQDAFDLLDLKSNTSAGGLPENEVRTHSMRTNRGPRDFILVNEPGLYRLTFQSRKAEAEAVKTWVCTKVLPQIREKGYYARPGLLRSGFDPQILVAQVTEAITAQTVRFDERLARLEQGRTMFTALPSVSVPPRTLRAELEALIEEVARRKRCHPGTIMLALYKEVRIRRHVDYRALKQNAYERTRRRYAVLDFVERDGNLPAVYNLALEHFTALIDRDLHPEAIEDAVFMCAEDPPTDDEGEAQQLAEWLEIESHRPDRDQLPRLKPMPGPNSCEPTWMSCMSISDRVQSFCSLGSSCSVRVMVSDKPS